MLESLKYAVWCGWYIVLFIPLFFLALIFIGLGVAALYAMFCNWIVPCTNSMRVNIDKTRKELEGNK